MKVNKKELLEALQTVQPAISKQSFLENADSIVISDNTVIAFNDQISIVSPISGLKDIKVMINAEKMLAFLKRVSQDEIDLEFKETEVEIKAGRSRAGILMQNEVTFSADSIEKPKKWIDVPEDFLEALKLTAAACAQMMSEVIMNCVYLKDNTVTGSDGNKILHYTLENDLKANALVPSKSIRAALSINPTQICFGDSWVHFKNAHGSVIHCRCIDDVYPDLTPILAMEGIDFTFPEIMTDTLQRAEIFKNDDNLIHFKITKNRVHLSSKDDIGWFEEELNVRYNDAPFEFDIVSELIKSVFSKVNNCLINEQALKFEGSNWVYFTLLLNMVD